VSARFQNELQFRDRFRTDEIEILSTLVDCHVPFFIDGSVACCFYNVRSVFDCTNDIDVVLLPNLIAAESGTIAMTSIYNSLGLVWPLAAENIALPNKRFILPNGLFDFRTADSVEFFYVHENAAQTVSLFNVQFKIASIASLITLKEAAINAGNEVDKHSADIENLRRLQEK
jgi:hypothetical protein